MNRLVCFPSAVRDFMLHSPLGSELLYFSVARSVVWEFALRTRFLLSAQLDDVAHVDCLVVLVGDSELVQVRTLRDSNANPRFWVTAG